ncbi:ABC transporter substrate-binding protein [Phytoactinopolyspora halotolerans]|uniref:Solute-binding protein family 5 domain-containing protein n=1 Tax=Phytoactinopolyspora halotolerans TaxID=1981512 RepID=A0A6L9SFG4_9ACTN|nr:ABC transporter substrate-binding protein [Phytoactinopolyspora halotolerans]NEE03966.1 hypothetical protein [Phytoactinopolyspora halotolerans]
MLMGRVEAGELPPVAERLPKQPFVVGPGTLLDDESVGFEPGRYGGTLQLPQRNPNFDRSVQIANTEPLLWSPGGFGYIDGESIEGNVLAGYEVNEQNTLFTFHMREGLRWSDGEPVTSEDVRFAFEDVLFNEQITPSVPTYLRAARRFDGRPAELAIIDQYTFSLAFDEPYGDFPAQLAGSGFVGYGDIIKPRHYLEQFHEKYADAGALEELMEGESIDEGEWYRLFHAKQMDGVQNVSDRNRAGHPTLTPWVMADSGTSVLRYERNPYYFKVDIDGNQLPYVDELSASVVEDLEALASRTLFGEFDYVGQELSIQHVPLLAERRDAGELNLHMPRNYRCPINFELNLTHPDEAWREVVRNVSFRRALSLAIDRQEILDTFFFSEFGSVPERVNPAENSQDEANGILDEMGLDQRDGDGFRLGPDGKRFTIPFEIVPRTDSHVPITELVAGYWKDIGIDTTLRQIDDGTQAELGNDIKASVFWVADPDAMAAGYGEDYLPHKFGAFWAPAWGEWYSSGGERGEEPPDAVRELYDLYEQMMAAEPESEERRAAADGMVDNYRENIWTIVPVESTQIPMPFSARLRNVPEGNSDVFSVVVEMSMEQWYIDE